MTNDDSDNTDGMKHISIFNFVSGVSEGDELQYLFNTGRFNSLPLNTTDGDISQQFVKLWVSFAREGYVCTHTVPYIHFLNDMM